MKKFKRNFVFVCLLFSCGLLMSSGGGWSPRILEGLYHQNVIEGKHTIFKAKVSASPEAEFRCFINNQIIVNSEEFMTSYKDGIALFIIAETFVHHSGRVKFEFTNTYGQSTTQADLTVTKSE